MAVALPVGTCRRHTELLPYQVTSNPQGFDAPAGNGILDVVYDLTTGGHVAEATDINGTPYPVLGYLNGPGYRGTTRFDPRVDPFPGRGGVAVNGPAHPAYFQESAVPLSSETHSGEEVAIYALGPGSDRVRGTVKNTHIYHVMKAALGLR
jgi:alkaline phosphatase